MLVLLVSTHKESFTTKDITKAVTTDSVVDTIMNPIEGIGKRVKFYIPFKKEFYGLKRYFRRR
jgi:hypothetical protein